MRPLPSPSRKGFTLIELLIVVVIIGILAAIAIPKFANTKEKAYLASMKSDLRNMATTEEGYFADQQTYVSGTASNGDTVLVSPGIYRERIDFSRKAITVKSLSAALE